MVRATQAKRKQLYLISCKLYGGCNKLNSSVTNKLGNRSGDRFVNRFCNRFDGAEGTASFLTYLVFKTVHFFFCNAKTQRGLFHRFLKQVVNLSCFYVEQKLTDPTFVYKF